MSGCVSRQAIHRMGLKIACILSTRDHPSRMGLDMLSLKCIEKYKRPTGPLKESGWGWGVPQQGWRLVMPTVRNATCGVWMQG